MDCRHEDGHANQGARSGCRQRGRVYHRPGVEREYRSDTLTRVEAIILLKYQAAFAGRDVLDIGVGTGRTSIYLAPLARRYEGVEYSPVMVEYLRVHQPQLAVRLADMRDLSAFTDATFDFVFGTSNVIDAVGEDGRRQTLREFARVLRPGGMLVFSSHNRHYARALEGPRLAPSHSLARLALNALRLPRQWRNHARLRAQREVHAEHALLDDPGHDLRVCTTTVSSHSSANSSPPPDGAPRGR